MGSLSPLLDRPAAEALRRIVLAQAATARAASDRLEDAGDAEALHDFRVALRRLRSHLRCWKAVLRPAVRKGLRRELRALQAATGEGRDAEVALDWIREVRAGLSPGAGDGVDYLDGVLSARLAAARAHAGSGVRDRFAEAATRLESRLRTMATSGDEGAPCGPDECLATALRRELAERCAEVLELLLAAPAGDGATTLHAARLAAKRLRYLVEPIRAEAGEARELVDRCKELQDLLGDLNDSQVLSEELAGRSEGVPEGVRAGLAELSALNLERRRALLEGLEARWLSDEGAVLRAAAETLGAALARSSG